MFKEKNRFVAIVILLTILFSQAGGLIKVYASNINEDEILEKSKNSLLDDEQILKKEGDSFLGNEQTPKENDGKLLRQNEEVLETDSNSNTLEANDESDESDESEEPIVIEDNILNSTDIIYDFFEIGIFKFFIEQTSPGSNTFDVTLLPLDRVNIPKLILPESNEILAKMQEKLQSDDVYVNNIIIGNDFLYHATLENNKDLTIPKGYTIIESSAFYWNKLTGVLELPDVVSIGAGAFSFNDLDKVIMPNIKEIEYDAFKSCGLKGILDLPKVESIGANAFAYNEFTQISLPNIQELAPNAFEYYVDNSTKEYLGIEQINIGNPELITNHSIFFNEDIKYKNYGYIPVKINDEDIQNKIIEEKGIIINPTNDEDFHETVTNHIRDNIDNVQENVKYLKYDGVRATDLDKNNQFYRLDEHLESVNGFYEVDTIETEERDGINYVIVYSDNSDDVDYYYEPIPTIDYYYETILLDKLIYNAKKLQIEDIESLIYKVTSNESLSNDDSNIDSPQEYIYLNTENFDDYISFEDCIENETLCRELIDAIKNDNNSYTDGTYYTYISNTNTIDGEHAPYLQSDNLNFKNSQIMVASNKFINLSFLNDNSFFDALKYRNYSYKTPSKLYLPGHPKTSPEPPISDDVKPPIVNDNKPSSPPSSGSGGGSVYRPSSDPKKDEVNVVEVINIEKDKKDEKLNLYDHIQYIQGYKDNTIRPTSFITREEVAAVFFRLLNDDYRESIRKNSVNYLDIPNDRWSVKHIGTLSSGNILEGYPDNTFRPTSTITRAEVAAIASRFDNLETLNHSIFSDVKGHWAEKYIDSAESKGWIKGYEDGTFKPDNPITRAEFITLVNNVLNRKVNKENIIDGINVFEDISPEQWYYEAIIEATNSHEYEENRLEDNSEIWTKVIYPSLEM